MLYAKTVRSTKARAEILSISLPGMPPDYFVIGKEDVPGINRMKTVVSDHPLFAEQKVSYIGQPVLLIAGPDREMVRDLVSRVEIIYREAKPVLSLEEAEELSQPFTDYHYEKGNMQKAFAEAASHIEDTFSTGYQEHVYLEPQGIAAEYKDGTLFVYGSMQCPYYVKNALLESMDLPEDKLRVIQTVTGGAFGGRRIPVPDGLSGGCCRVQNRKTGNDDLRQKRRYDSYNQAPPFPDTL
ncbi:MAG: molybdopterin cofactor-binding domain-containing protein [Candidatus Marinimicrobia bacterium]|nr:molybdopterin cofactor-binding domain-containing protein [Candidatus Neomarinimicrobiota bacterium]